MGCNKAIGTIEERFWKRVKVGSVDECWEWIGGRIPSGYGMFNRKVAHRMAYEYLVGEIPDQIQLDHQCHNKACCNPNHLRLATRIENSRNRLKGRNNTSGFKGVWMSHGKWESSIRVNGYRVYLGSFDSPEEAHCAYCTAAEKLHGQFFNAG